MTDKPKRRLIDPDFPEGIPVLTFSDWRKIAPDKWECFVLEEPTRVITASDKEREAIGDLLVTYSPESGKKFILVNDRMMLLDHYLATYRTANPNRSSTIRIFPGI